jgi:hypothetical protein
VILLVLFVWSLLVFFCFLDVSAFSQEFIDDDPWRFGSGNEMDMARNQRDGYGLETCIALGVCFFLLPFWQYAYRADCFSFAHSLWTACINELYEPFLTLIYFLLLTCLRDYSMESRCVVSLEALSASTLYLYAQVQEDTQSSDQVYSSSHVLCGGLNGADEAKSTQVPARVSIVS